VRSACSIWEQCSALSTTHLWPEEEYLEVEKEKTETENGNNVKIEMGAVKNEYRNG
jgi:hypothetical protein